MTFGSRSVRPHVTPRRRETAARWLGLAVVVLLVAAAISVPPLVGWNVYVAGFPPLLADWRPHVGPGTLPSLAIAVLTIAFGIQAAERARWPILLIGSFVVALAWIVSLATVDGLNGIAHVLDWHTEYLIPARSVTDVGSMLRGFIGRIPLDSVGAWPAHVAGHPPGAFLFFVLLVRVGLGSGLAAGLVVIVIAATTPAAVLITARRLGAERSVRRAAPFLVVGPAAVWLGVSADAMFGAVAAWGLCCLAVSATASGRGARIGFGALAGLLLGFCVLLSYGLPLLGVLALAILICARSWRPLLPAIGGALVVVLAFATAGFAWWTAYPVLVRRYDAGVASMRPQAYWIWANLAVLALCAGPILGPAVATVAARGRAAIRGETRAIAALVIAAATIIVLADVSGMSKAEVERIWLPFVPWLLLATALLPARWRRMGLIGNIVVALAIQHLLHTAW
jgi:hypothetical protein